MSCGSSFKSSVRQQRLVILLVDLGGRRLNLGLGSNFVRGERRLWFVPSYGEVQDVGVAKQRNPEGALDIREIGDFAHDRRHDRGSDNGHHQQRRATFGEGTKIFDAQGKNRRKHDGVKESDEHHSVNGDGAGGCRGHHGAKEGAQSENRQQARGLNGFHQRGAGETADHEAHRVQHQIFCSVARPEKRLRVHHKADDEAADAHLGSDVQELRDDGVVKMFVSEDSAPACGCVGFVARCSLADFRQVRKINDGGNGEKNPANDQVRNANRSRLRGTISLQGRRAEAREFLRARHCRRKNERPDNVQRHDVPDAIKGLREIQAPLAAFRRAENCRVGIGGNLQETLAASQHERRKQEQSVNAERAGGDKEEGARGAEKKAAENSALVANAFHQAAGDDGRKKVAAEEGNLNEGGLKVAQAKRGFEVGNENVVEVDAEGPEEKETRDQDKGENIFSFGQWGGLGGQVSSVLPFEAQRWRRKVAATSKRDRDGRSRRQREHAGQ